MTILLLILIALACFLLGVFILVQNPKGGGIGSIGGGISSSFSNQFGVQSATNILEKGTYILIAVIAVLSITSVYFFPNSSDTQAPNDDVNEILNNITFPTQETAPPVTQGEGEQTTGFEEESEPLLELLPSEEK